MGAEFEVPSKRAVTLVEVLTAIAVLLVVSAILFPVIARAKLAGLRTVAVSNTRQVAQAVLLYAGSNDDLIPPRPHSRSGYWMEKVGLVQDGRASLVDPLFSPSLGTQPPETYRTLGGYALNSCIRPDKSSHSFSDQGRTVLVAPVTFWHVRGVGEHHYIPYVWLHAPDDRTDRWIREQFSGAEIDFGWNLGSKRYFGKGVYAFLDGHIQSIAPDGFYVSKSDPCGWEQWDAANEGTLPTFSARSAAPLNPQ